ncbi:hypothetical protein [Vitreimonas flagellata]|uniref:hypothetical protein n=1 Tax=Vitreimonas flagellata TaxID=2560861 RepID=UPI001075372D|nr:hypothetical protein [Vitreimonas flagellata]
MKVTKHTIEVDVVRPPPRKRIDQARAKRAGAIAVKPAKVVALEQPLAPRTIELMADDANEKVRRTRVLDGCERAFRRGFLRGQDDLYRVARCIEQDFLALLPPSGGLRLERLRRGMSECFALMPSGGGVSTRAPQARREDALDRLRSAEAAAGARDVGMLRAWLVEDLTLRAIATRFRIDNSNVSKVLLKALERVNEGAWNARRRRREPAYEQRKWQVDVLAEAM